MYWGRAALRERERRALLQRSLWTAAPRREWEWEALSSGAFNYSLNNPAACFLQRLHLQVFIPRSLSLSNPLPCPHEAERPLLFRISLGRYLSPSPVFGILLRTHEGPRANPNSLLDTILCSACLLLSLASSFAKDIFSHFLINSNSICPTHLYRRILFSKSGIEKLVRGKKIYFQNLVYKRGSLLPYY